MKIQARGNRQEAMELSNSFQADTDWDQARVAVTREGKPAQSFLVDNFEALPNDIFAPSIVGHQVKARQPLFLIHVRAQKTPR